MAQQVDFLLSGIRGNDFSPHFNRERLAGGKVSFYQPGTTNTQNVWAETAESTVLTQPVRLDSNGVAVVYANGTYDIVIKDADDKELVSYASVGYGPSAIGAHAHTSAATGGPLYGWQLIESQVPTASSTYLSFTTGIDAAYDVYMFVLTDLRHNGTGDVLVAEVRSGSTWRQGGNTYRTKHHTVEASYSGADFTGAYWQTTRSSVGGGSDDGMSGIIYMYSPATSARKTTFSSQITSVSSTNIFQVEFGGGGYMDAAEAHNGVQFAWSVQTWLAEGSIALYGLRK